MKKEIAIILPYKEIYSNNHAGAASIWIKDYDKLSSLSKKTVIYGNLDKGKKPLTKNFKNLTITKTTFSKTKKYISLFYKDYRTLAGLFYIINYFFDCVDGNYARKYNLVSKIGDLLDHLTDIIVSIIILCIMYKKNSKLFIYFIPLITIMVLFTLIDLGCREKHSKFKSPTLNFTKAYCVNETVEEIASNLNLGFINILIMLTIFFYN